MVRKAVALKDRLYEDFICKLDIFPSISMRDIVSINELNLMLGNNLESQIM
jgi:hypothetical protein